MAAFLACVMTRRGRLEAVLDDNAEDGLIGWFENYDEAIAEAKKTGKPIFLEFRCSP